MVGIGSRFVGLEKLPSRLSKFDAEAFFSLTTEDVAAIKARFRSDRHVGVALQLVFLRASGRTLDRFAAVPRALLAHIGSAVGATAPTIASLQSIYKRRSTLYEHQLWARTHAGIGDLDAPAQVQLREMLAFAAADASSIDELVRAAAQWVFEQRILLPAERTLRDFAREAFAQIEQQALAAVEARLPRSQWPALLAKLYAKRPGRNSTTAIEWLKTAAGRHSPGTLTEVLEKIAILRDWRVHEWHFGEALSLQRQHGYAQAFGARTPSIAKRQLETSQVVEAVCFLRITLLQLTDQALQMAGRRTVDLVRRAHARSQKRFAQSAHAMRQCLDAIDAIVNDDSRPAEERLGQVRQLLTEHGPADGATQAARTRAALADDGGGVRSLLSQLVSLPFEGKDEDHGLRQWRALCELRERNATELPDAFDAPVRRGWQDLVNGPDRRKALRAFEAATMMSLRTSLRRGSVWIPHSQTFRDREDMLIPRDTWEANRSQHLQLLRQPATAEGLGQELKELLSAGLQALSEAVDRGAVEIRDGEIHIPALRALDVEKTPTATRDLLFRTIGEAQLPDILVEMDAATGFSQCLLAGRARDERELLAVYAGLLAHGTEVDAKSVAAMIPGLEAAQVSSAMRAIEAPGRLRRANQAVLDFQARHPISQLWGDGERASADMMSLDASRHLWSARIDPRRRTPAAGMYTHVLNRHAIAYDMPVVLNERQAGPAIEGVERYNAELRGDRSRLTLLAVDTHGYTHVGMAFAKLLHFDLCPRLKSLPERKLYLPRDLEVPDNLEPVVAREVSWRPIEQGWDELLRAAASLKSGRVSAVVLMQRLGSSAQGDLLYRAADSFGKLLRTVYLCDYFAQPAFRREILTLLNRGESVHQLQRAIYYGRIAPERGRRADEMIAISGSHALLTNVVLAWNVARMEDTVRSLRLRGTTIEDDWLRRMGPAHFSHINFRGLLSFPLRAYRDALIAAPAGSRRPAAA